MPVPVLKLNLVPPPTPWRVHHTLIGWAVLAAGILALAGTLAATGLAYRQAMIAGRNLITLDARSKEASKKQSLLQARLQAIDVEKELPRWRLAERILSERGVPWSRLSAELERSLVQDVRLHSIQRTRDTSQNIQLKLKVEARSRASEDAFLTSLNKNAFFTGVILERESEAQGGGIDLECTLPVASTPTSYTSLPKYGPERKNAPTPAPAKTAARPLQTPRPTPPPMKAQPSVARPVATPAPTPKPVMQPPPYQPQMRPEPPFRRHPMPGSNQPGAPEPGSLR